MNLDDFDATLFRHRARLVRVVDGDTLDLEVDVAFAQPTTRLALQVRVRLRGVNAPETRGPEKEHGRAVKDDIEFLLSGPSPDPEWPLRIQTWKDGTTLGRYVADVWTVCREVTGPGLALRSINDLVRQWTDAEREKYGKPFRYDPKP